LPHGERRRVAMRVLPRAQLARSRPSRAHDRVGVAREALLAGEERAPLRVIHDHARQAPVGNIVASDFVNAHDTVAKRLKLVVDAPRPPVARVHEEDARLVDRYLCPGSATR
jgi:hypothetical protein